MKLFSLVSPEEKKILFIPLLFFLLIIISEVTAILLLNSGLIVYTIDDSYIHLALAENILRGHYGVNLQEFSSPSSSIVWPFMLAPFINSGFGYLVPLIINISSAFGILLIFFLIIKQIFHNDSSNNNNLYKASLLFLLLLIPASNLIGSLFSGMEHTLQLFFTLLILQGLFTAIQQKYISNWFLASLVVAPLVRYENLALSIASLIFLFSIDYKKKAILVFILIVLTTGSFSIFLLNLGLEVLPLSVINKSDVVSSGSLNSIIDNFRTNIFNPRSGLLFISMLFLVYFSSTIKKIKEERLLAGCIAFAILLHLLAGKPGRYMVYIWTATILTFLFLYKDWIKKIIIKNSFFKTAAILIIITIILSYYYIISLIAVPVASNNIYEQQFQMHRFVSDYYKRPVAVNDLGYVSFRNDYYVHDLVGLASIEVQRERKNSQTPDWMNKTAKAHNVKLAMIYDSWFHELPDNWLKVAELYLGKIKIAPSDNVVSFYILDNEIKNEVIPLLNSFRETLPDGVKLVIKE